MSTMDKGFATSQRLHRAHRIPGRVHGHRWRSGASSIRSSSGSAALPGRRRPRRISVRASRRARRVSPARSFAIEGATYLKDQDYPEPRALGVTPGFFATLNIPLVSGRASPTPIAWDALPGRDRVNARFRQRSTSTNADPIGRRIRLGGAESTAPWVDDRRRRAATCSAATRRADPPVDLPAVRAGAPNLRRTSRPARRRAACAHAEPFATSSRRSIRTFRLYWVR